MEREQLTSALTELVFTCHQRATGAYLVAKEMTVVQYSTLRTLYTTIATDGSNQKEDLVDLIISMGAEAPDCTNVGEDKLLRIWKNVNACFAGDDAGTALLFCQQGEELALHAYQSLLQIQTALPGEVAALLSVQRQEVKISRDLIKALRDKYKTVKRIEL